MLFIYILHQISAALKSIVDYLKSKFYHNWNYQPSMELNIPLDEVKSRWDRTRDDLIKNHKNALIVPLGVNFGYYFGKESKPSERLILGIIPANEEVFIIAPSFEKSNIIKATGIEDVITWEETESPYKVTSKEFKERKIGSNLISDPHLWIIEAQKLEKELQIKIQSGHDIIDGIRMKKSEWEIRQLKAAAKASTEGILAAIPQLKVGITELEFQKIINRELTLQSGSNLSFGLIQFGENSAIPHSMPSHKKLHNDNVVLLDCGTPINGYQGDITITVPFGKPKDFQKIYDIVFEANRKALDADKEGMIPAELDGIARKHITEAGYGKYFTHRLGHGIGIEVHESPYIVGTNHSPLQEDNCHTIEPGIYIPGKFGVRIEDDVWVQKNKTVLLYETPRHNF